MSSGAVYIITQDLRYVDLLLTSAGSLKRAMPELPITVFSQFPVESTLFDKIITVEPSEDGFYDKTRFMSASPYQRTMFIDADTYVLEAVPELFSVLDHFDCAATHEEYTSTDWFKDYPRPQIPSSFPEFNTGLLMLKQSPKVEHLLEQWGTLYAAYLEAKPGRKLNDQPFFREAVYGSEVRIATLTREYNCKFRGQGYLNGPLKIMHGHHNFQLKPAHVSKAARALNASLKPRVYIAGQVYEQRITGRLVGRRKGHKVGSFPEPPESITLLRVQRLREVVKKGGIKQTLGRALGNK